MLKFNRADETDHQNVDPLVDLRRRMTIPREGATLQSARHSFTKICEERRLANEAYLNSLHIDLNQVGGARQSDKTRHLEQELQEKDTAVKKARADLQTKREAHGREITKALGSAFVEYEHTVSQLLVMIEEAVELGFDVQSRCRQYGAPLPRSLQAAVFMQMKVKDLRNMLDGGAI